MCGEIELLCNTCLISEMGQGLFLDNVKKRKITLKWLESEINWGEKLPWFLIKVLILNSALIKLKIFATL